MTSSTSETQLITEVASKIKNEIDPVFKDMIGSSSEVVASKGMLELGSWYKKRRNYKGDPLSHVVDTVVSTLTRNLPQHFANVAVTNIKISSKGKQKGTKFDAAPHKEEIKPYVEFTIKSNGAVIKSTKAQFVIRATFSFKDLELSNNKNELSLGKLALDLTIFLLSLPFAPIQTPVMLGRKEITNIDLSKLSMAV